MSWLSDLAGKAEAFLDRVDQATASTLQDAGIVKNTPKSNPSSPFPAKDSSQSLTAQSLTYEPTAARRSSTTSTEKAQGATVAQILVGSASESPLLLKNKGGPPRELKKDLSINANDSGLSRTSSLPGLSGSTKTGLKNQTRESDDVLFEFLNTPSSKTQPAYMIRSTPKVRTGPSTSNLDMQMSKQTLSLPGPPLSPVKAQPSVSTAANDGVRSQWQVGDITSKLAPPQETRTRENDSNDVSETKLEETDSPLDKEGVPHPDPKGEERVEVHQQSNVPESQSAPSGDLNGGQNQPQNSTNQILIAEADSLRQKVSNLELENKLLKREVASLSDEMGSLMTRLNEASDSTSQYEREIQSLREQVSQSDHVIRQLRSHDDDLQALLEARDQQIAVLRTQLAEGDRTAEQLRVMCPQHRERKNSECVKLSLSYLNVILWRE